MMSDKTFDKKHFRRALGQFPTGITIITACDKTGRLAGMTANSFHSVSLNPPLIAWCIDKSSYGMPIYEQAEHFAVNILGKDQTELSLHFASRQEDKFADINYHKGAGGSPLLENCAAQFECKTSQMIDAGDHVVMMGEVLDYRYDEMITPLVFSRGAFAATMQHPSSLPHNQAHAEPNEFLSNYLLYLLNIAFTNYTAQLYPRLAEHASVTPEEWRVLTSLNMNAPVKASAIARLVMQPDVEFKETIQFLVDKGWVDFDPAQDQLALTQTGRELTEKLIALARAHEAELLDNFSQTEITQLKEGLKTIIDNF